MESIASRFTVAAPCSEDPANLRPTGTPHEFFCDRCMHPVHDLSQMTARQARAFAERHESMCVRYFVDADGYILVKAEPELSLTKRAMATVAVPLALIACAPGSSHTPALTSPAAPIVVSPHGGSSGPSIRPGGGRPTSLSEACESAPRHEAPAKDAVPVRTVQPSEHLPLAAGPQDARQHELSELARLITKEKPSIPQRLQAPPPRSVEPALEVPLAAIKGFRALDVEHDRAVYMTAGFAASPVAQIAPTAPFAPLSGGILDE